MDDPEQENEKRRLALSPPDNDSLRFAFTISRMTRLSDCWCLEAVFATAWIGTVSMLWPAIKTSTQFGLVVGWGIRFAWPYSIAYILIVYAISFVVIVWLGFAVYLTLFDKPTPHYLVRGFWTALLTVGIVQGIMVNFAGRNLSWTSRWLPYVAALMVCMEVARRTVSRSSAPKPAGC